MLYIMYRDIRKKECMSLHSETVGKKYAFHSKQKSSKKVLLKYALHYVQKQWEKPMHVIAFRNSRKKVCFSLNTK
jgi:hypothetical protein